MKTTFIRTIIFILINLYFKSRAQETDSTFHSRNHSYFELLGNAALGVYSFNYERVLNNKGSCEINFRAGLGIQQKGSLNCPVMFYLVSNRNGKNHFVFGTGALYQHEELLFYLLKKDEVFITTSIGYRNQKPKGGVLFQIAWTPTIYGGRYSTLEENLKYSIPFFFPGISLGYTFKNNKR